VEEDWLEVNQISREAETVLIAAGFSIRKKVKNIILENTDGIKWKISGFMPTKSFFE